MPYLKCNSCHHEWEGSKNSRCSWCGSDGYILEPKTPLEKVISSGTFRELINKLVNEYEEDNNV